MVPDFEKLMRPVLEKANEGEMRISNVVNLLGVELQLSEADLSEMLPSGKQTRFANRVHWAKSYLKQAGLVKATRRAHFIITDRGRQFLESHSGDISKYDLEKFEEYQEFLNRTNSEKATVEKHQITSESSQTPDEKMRNAYTNINATLAEELIDRVRELSPAFFERMIVDLLISMGYGGSEEEAGQALGQSGDGGVDGVIDQDPLGVDQIYIQAKRYAAGNNIGSGAIRDFFGALNIKKASKGIFVTTSDFSSAARDTAQALGTRIVLINSQMLAKLMIRYNIGCRVEETLYLKKLDEDFFEEI